MLRSFFNALQATPVVSGDDVIAYARECVVACDLIIDTLRDEAVLPQPELHRLMTLMWQLVGNKVTPMVLDPVDGLPSLHFCCIVRRPPLPNVAFFVIPKTFLDQVRTDPLMQCCAMVHMASQACDYHGQRLHATQTLHRAQAYEAAFLRAIRPQWEQEGLPWKLNAYQQGVLTTYPAGLDSLPADQRYAPPADFHW